MDWMDGWMDGRKDAGGAGVDVWGKGGARPNEALRGRQQARLSSMFQGMGV